MGSLKNVVPDGLGPTRAIAEGTTDRQTYLTGEVVREGGYARELEPRLPRIVSFLYARSLL